VREPLRPHLTCTGCGSPLRSEADIAAHPCYDAGAAAERMRWMHGWSAVAIACLACVAAALLALLGHAVIVTYFGGASARPYGPARNAAAPRGDERGVTAPHGPKRGARAAMGDIASPSDGTYIANTSTRRFHRRSCRYASCTNCTAAFHSREEALASGFRPAGCCDP